MEEKFMNRKQWALGSVTALVILLWSGAASAQYGHWGMGGTMRPNSEMLQQQYGLNEEQSRRYLDLHKSSRDRFDQLHTNLWLNQRELSRLWRADEIDEKALRERFNALEQSRRDLQEAQLNYLLDLRRGLPADRWEQLAQGGMLGFDSDWDGGQMAYGPGLGGGMGFHHGMRGGGYGPGWGGGYGGYGPGMMGGMGGYGPGMMGGMGGYSPGWSGAYGLGWRGDLGGYGPGWRGDLGGTLSPAGQPDQQPGSTQGQQGQQGQQGKQGQQGQQGQQGHQGQH
jgi:Spy/CpxP family protein refolding chaperone